MTPDTWIPRDPEPHESRKAAGAALAAAAVVGGVVYYLTRTLLARDPIRLRPPTSQEGEKPRERAEP